MIGQIFACHLSINVFVYVLIGDPATGCQFKTYIIKKLGTSMSELATPHRQEFLDAGRHLGTESKNMFFILFFPARGAHSNRSTLGEVNRCIAHMILPTAIRALRAVPSSTSHANEPRASPTPKAGFELSSAKDACKDAAAASASPRAPPAAGIDMAVAGLKRREVTR